MGPATARALTELNRRFYRRYAEEFDRTRSRPWRGWARILAAVEERRGREGARVLDLGCGNGRFADSVAAAGWRRVRWLGIDLSVGLLLRGRERTAAMPGRHRLVAADLLTAPLPVGGRFDLVALFGVLHHVPSHDARRRLISAALERVRPGGCLALSLWQFLDQPGRERRSVPWSRLAEVLELAGVTEAAADGVVDDRERASEPGDRLLRWGEHDGLWPVRYCHHADDEEARRLLRGMPVATVLDFHADGPSGRANRYLLLARS